MREEKMATACLIVGIMSSVLCCACLGFPLGVAGIVLFVLSIGKDNRISEKAGFGLALSILGIILSIIMAIFIIKLNLMTINSESYDNYKYNNPYEYYDHDDYYDFTIEGDDIL